MLLTVDRLETFYGVSQVLFGVSFALGAGQLVALMGRNGMGKTTTIRSIMGLTPARRGTIMFGGDTITRMKPFRIARLGIGLVPEGRRVFANLTVEQNLIATARAGENSNWTLQRVHDLFPRLAERHDQLARTLSGGEQQMLAIARALLTNPKLLILDEATEGLAPLVRQEIWSAIETLKQDGLSLLVVDKNLKELAAVADHCVVLEKGQAVWSGEIGDLNASDDLKRRYLGV